MPRRSLLTPAERAELFAFPGDEGEIIRRYTLSTLDLSVIRRRRGDHNRLGFAVLLCCLRYPGFILPPSAEPPFSLLAIVGQQLQISPSVWPQYAQRAQTRREHLVELQAWLQLTVFSTADYRRLAHQLAELARQTDRGPVLAAAMVDWLRQQRIILPTADVIDRLCSEALARGTRQVHEALIAPLSAQHRQALDQLLTVREGTKNSGLVWLRQPPIAPKPRHVLVHLERLKAIDELSLPPGLEQAIHQNRLLKLAREGGQMTAQHLRDLEPARRYATLMALLLDIRATLIDEIIDLHDRYMGSVFSKAKRNHADQFQQSGKAINDKVRLYSRIGRALLDAKQSGGDPFAAIEAIISWDVFSQSIAEAEQWVRPENFDFLSLIGDSFNPLRRYTPTMLAALSMKAAPAALDLLAGVDVLKDMNARQARKVPDDAPTSFVRKRWENLVWTPDGLDRRFYELCVLTELKNSLRSGDIWVQGSRQFKDFEEYLLPPQRFAAQHAQQGLGLAVETDCASFLDARLALLEKELATVERLAAANELPDAAITSHGRLKITPLDNAVPPEATALMEQAYGLLPHLKITELLLEVDNWIGFTRHFTHLKSGAPSDDQHLLLTAILADAINLGLSKMAESCPGTTYAKLSWLQAWHIRAHWDDILRLTASIQQGTVTASLMLRKLGSYPRQHGLAVALRELGRIERTLFALDWMQNVELRRRVQIGLNKGEAKNALARAVFLNRLGEIRDRSFENQRYRASGLNLVVAAIVLWNTVYIERAVHALRDSGKTVDEILLPHLSPLGWEHINLTGDYIWPQSHQVKQGQFRPLRTPGEA